jgi:hypothetical protein
VLPPSQLRRIEPCREVRLTVPCGHRLYEKKS